MSAGIAVAEMVKKLGSIGAELGLRVEYNVVVPDSIGSAKRRVKVVFSKIGSGGKWKKLGVDCVYIRIGKNGIGTMNQRVNVKFYDVQRYPFSGVLVYTGSGYLDNSQKVDGLPVFCGAIHLNQFKNWLQQFFAHIF